MLPLSLQDLKETHPEYFPPSTLSFRLPKLVQVVFFAVNPGPGSGSRTNPEQTGGRRQKSMHRTTVRDTGREHPVQII